MTPITHGIQITKVKTLLLVQLDGRHNTSNLASDKGSFTAMRFVIEEDSVRVVGFAVVDSDPVRV